jgi:hypothetical protein
MLDWYLAYFITIIVTSCCVIQYCCVAPLLYILCSDYVLCYYSVIIVVNYVIVICVTVVVDHHCWSIVEGQLPGTLCCVVDDLFSSGILCIICW